jgi:hypothetical protein
MSMIRTGLGSSLAVAMMLAVGAGGCDNAVSRGGGPGTSMATVDGTINGASLTVNDHFAATTKASSTSGGSAAILITDTAGVCSAAGRGEQPKSVTGLTLLVYATDGAAKSIAPTETGTYTVSSATPAAGMKTVVAVYGGTDDMCKSKMFKLADSGKVELTRIDASSYAGSFDLVFGSDHITGTFDVPECAGAANAAAGTLTCV